MSYFTGSDGRRITEGDRVTTPSGKQGSVTLVGREHVYVSSDTGSQVVVSRSSAHRISKES